jgi:hypothetical protein
MSDNSLIPEQDTELAEPEKRGVGRPRAMTPRQLQNGIDKYFEPFGKELVRVEGDTIRVPTICGLAYSLGIDRNTLIAWSKEKDSEYSSVARACITRLTSYWEEYAATGKSPSGAAFWLRNHGWDGDKQITQAAAETTKDGTVRVVVRVVGSDIPMDV